jgi:6-pyruvoyltetrahydropterin/6-carboxytetrahydropterin synthase
MYIRVTKEFRFEMAHALLNHDGPCKNIHGHSYLLAVTLKGVPISDSGNSKEGMVVDFSDIKKIVTEKIVQPLDHALVLNRTTPEKMYIELQDLKLILVDFQPTCENMLIDIAEKLIKVLPETVTLHHLMLRETSTSYAEWFAEDNMHN